MRVDARNLLDRLGRSNFSYKEFEDRFTELELWPLLEALLKDPRLQALDGAAAEAAPAAAAEQARMGEDATPFDALFRRYEQGAPATAPAAPPPLRQDVRALLRRLSDLGANGEL